MIKTIDFAGIELDNYTVREMIMNVEKDMSDHGFHTIEEVNMDTLMLAETDELVRKAIGFAEHTVIAENGILEAVGAGSYRQSSRKSSMTPRATTHRGWFLPRAFTPPC